MKKLTKILFIFTLLIPIAALVIGGCVEKTSGAYYFFPIPYMYWEFIPGVVYLLAIVFNIILVIKNRKNSLEKIDYFALGAYYLLILLIFATYVVAMKRAVYLVSYATIIYYIKVFLIVDAIFRTYSILTFLKPKRIK